MNRPERVAIALGSNLGDRDAHLDFAFSRLSAILADAHFSHRHNTAPVDVVGEQPTFLNAAVVGLTRLGPHDLLRALLQIESDRGRQRPFANAPRTLDLDLILYGDLVIAGEGLVVPHARFRDRAFVLEPLAEVAPDLVDPVTGITIQDLLARLTGRR